MEEQKRYYWMRLRTDFFEDDRIDYLEEQEHGAEFIVIYLKLALKSLKSDGLLYRNIGDSIVPYCYEKLSSMLRMPLQIVTDALQTLVTVGLVDVKENGIYSFPQVQELTGSDVATDNAIRQRRYRERKKAEENAKKVEEFLSSVTNSNVTSVTKSNAVTLRNSNERESKRKRLEIDIDI